LDIKNIDWAATDALCFDMDGTLWDAVDSYCEIWNRCFRKVGMDRVVARQELIACMGLNLHEILRRLCGGVPMPDADAFLSDIEREEIRLMPVLGALSGCRGRAGAPVEEIQNPVAQQLR
jgi:phosphoglycolate phosphatase